ncbi:MAG: IS110 family transposase [Bacteroidetes bacterium]|nr:IS110 family transposase [Bacteroidota bacterium]
MVCDTQAVYAAFIGIDWSDQKHDYCLSVAGSESWEVGQIDSCPEVVHAWVNQLRQRFSGKPVAICLEQTKGALIYQLMAVDFIEVYPLNPQALANYRNAFCVSRAKDDPTDAQLLWEYLVKHRNRLRVWTPEDVDTRLLAMLVEDRRKMLDLRTELSNKLTAALKAYFPQALHLSGDKITSSLACEFLQRWTTLPQLKRCRDKTIEDLYKKHHVRTQKTIDARLDLIHKSVPLVEDPAIVETSVLKVQSLVRQIVCINEDIQRYDQRIAHLFDAHPERDLFDSFPGAGPVMAPRLLVAMGTDRERYDLALDVATFTGIAPVTERSGKHTIVHWRLACPKFVRQTFHEFANLSRHQSTWAQAYYEIQRGRGKSHHAAIRALAFKWIRIIYRCWKQRVVYDEAKYLKALMHSGSPLIDFMTKAA